MITKITAENELEFFAKGFEAITKALAACPDTPNILIDSLESYYSNLEYIKLLPTQNNEQGKYLLVPFDEPFFEIDANARVIHVPDVFKKNGVAVQGDHNAELLVFKVDRYFDYQDLLDTQISINWNFTPYGARQPAEQGYDKAFARDAFYKDPNYIIFGFIITKDMTPSRGVLNFSVDFYTVNNEAIDYSLNTTIASVNVNEGLTLTDPSVVKEVDQGFLGRISNSSYTPESQTPVADPVWQTGEEAGGVRSGLDSVVNFDYVDGVNEADEVILTAQGYTPGANTGVVVKYKWSVSPAQNGNGVIVEEEIPAETVEPNRATSVNDYFKTNDVIAANSPDLLISTYYKKVGGVLDVDHPLIGQDAIDAYENGDELYELGSSYVAKMAGNYSVEAYGYRESMTNVEADAEEPMPYDPNCSLQLTVRKLVTAPNDVNKQVSQANQNAIVVYQNNNNVSVAGKLASLYSFASTNPSQGEAKWLGFDIEANVESITELTWNGGTLTADDVAESASVGLAENHIIFWAKAEALPRVIRIGNGADEVSIKFSFVEAQIMTATSNTIRSNVCEIPVAAKPVIEDFTISTSLPEGSYIVENNEEGYVYIANDAPPAVEALIGSSNDQPLGMVAVEMINANASEEDLALDIEKINEGIENGKYNFAELPANRKVSVSNDATSEGEYQIRVLNHRNHTYSVSDLSNRIKTSFVAPVINQITVKGQYRNNPEVLLLDNGAMPEGSLAVISYVDNASDKRINFVLEDNSENFEQAEAFYFVEEVEKIEGTNEYRVKNPGDNGQTGPDEFAIEVITNDDMKSGSFVIDGDLGTYRIRVENHYHGTVCVAYTDVFAVHAAGE